MKGANPLTVGARASAGNSSFIGGIDEIRVSAMAKGPPPTPPAACAADQVVNWDGSKYVCRNQRVCPADMVDTGAFCIDKVRTAAADWQEWIGSCNRRVALGITVPFDGNFEYVDEYGVMNDFPGGAYDQSYVSVGATECGRVYDSGWGCSSSTCYDSTHAGGADMSRCCR